MEFFEMLDWKTLLLAGAITTFLVSAINTIQQKVSTNWLVFIVSLIVTLLITTFTPGASLGDIQRMALELLFTMAFSVMFYNYLGKWFIDQLFEWIKKKLSDRFGKPNVPSP